MPASAPPPRPLQSFADAVVLIIEDSQEASEDNVEKTLEGTNKVPSWGGCG